MTDSDEQEKREGAEVLLSLKRGRDELNWGSDSNKSEHNWLSAQEWVGGDSCALCIVMIFLMLSKALRLCERPTS